MHWALNRVPASRWKRPAQTSAAWKGPAEQATRRKRSGEAGETPGRRAPRPTDAAEFRRRPELGAVGEDGAPWRFAATVGRSGTPPWKSHVVLEPRQSPEPGGNRVHPQVMFPKRPHAGLGKTCSHGALAGWLVPTAAPADSASARREQVGGHVAGCCLLLWMVAARCSQVSKLSCALKTGTLFAKIKIQIELMKYRYQSPPAAMASQPASGASSPGARRQRALVCLRPSSAPRPGATGLLPRAVPGSPGGRGRAAPGDRGHSEATG